MLWYYMLNNILGHSCDPYDALESISKLVYKKVDDDYYKISHVFLKPGFENYRRLSYNTAALELIINLILNKQATLNSYKNIDCGSGSDSILSIDNFPVIFLNEGQTRPKAAAVFVQDGRLVVKLYPLSYLKINNFAFYSNYGHFWKDYEFYDINRYKKYYIKEHGLPFTNLYNFNLNKTASDYLNDLLVPYNNKYWNGYKFSKTYIEYKIVRFCLFFKETRSAGVYVLQDKKLIMRRLLPDLTTVDLPNPYYYELPLDLSFSATNLE